MRHMMGALLLCLAPLGASAANAQAANAAAPGTIELRLSAVGQSVRRPDLVTIYVPIHTNGESATAARSANAAAIAALTDALVARGIDRGAITRLSSPSPYGFIGNALVDTNEGPQPFATANAKRNAYSTIRIRLGDASLVTRVRETLDQQDQTMVGAPIYSLVDDRDAKNAAIADAIAKVKQDAAAYAAPLGLRVERITSVSSYGDATAILSDENLVTRMIVGEQQDGPEGVTTRVQVWVTFTLTSR